MTTRNKLGWLAVLGGLYVLIKINAKTSYDTEIRVISATHASRFHRAALVKALIKVESGFNPRAHRETEREDSRGLMQINAPTARALGVTDLDTLFDSGTNIETGNRLLDELESRYDILQDVIAAWNAGEVNLDDQGNYTNSVYVFDVMKNYTFYSLFGV